MILAVLCSIRIMENSVDPDQLTSQKSADLDLHCFENSIYLVISVVLVKTAVSKTT